MPRPLLQCRPLHQRAHDPMPFGLSAIRRKLKQRAIRNEHYKSLLPISPAEIDEWYQLSVADRNTRNMALIDQNMVRFHQLHVRRAKRRYGGYQLLYFHIPKTGGTTLEFLFAKNYLINGVLHLNAPNHDRNPWCLIKGERIPRVLMGHYELNDLIYQCLDRHFVHLTLLREPVKRVLSYYDYIQTKPQHPMHARAKDLSVGQYLNAPFADEVRNSQTYRLLGLLREGAWRNDPRSEERLVDDAKVLLAERYTLVGVTERFAEFILLCQRMLGWRDPFCEPHNVSRKKTHPEDLPQQELDTMRSLNAMDAEVHQYAAELFAQHFEKAGLTETDATAFQKRSDDYHSVLSKQRDDIVE